MSTAQNTAADLNRRAALVEIAYELDGNYSMSEIDRLAPLFGLKVADLTHADYRFVYERTSR